MKTKVGKKFNLYFVAIIILMIVGFFLRTYYLNDNKVIFAYDQARDAYIASQISQGDLKILGPPVSIGNLYHGVLFYYFISIPYYLSKGNPIVPIIFISFLNIAVIPLIYFLGKIIFNKKTGLLAAVIYTISFDIIQYSNWLANPSLAVPFSILLYLGLTLLLFSNKKTLGVLLTAVGYGLCFQSEFFLGYLIIPILFTKFFFKIKLTKKQIIIFILTTGFILSTMILSYFKFGFTFIEGFKSLLQKGSGSQNFELLLNLKHIINRLGENFYRTVIPINKNLALIFAFICIVFSIQQIRLKTKLAKPLLFLWIFLLSQAIIIPFGGDHIPYINAGLQLPVILITAIFLIYLLNIQKYISILLIIIFMFFPLLSDIKYNPTTQILYDIPKDLNIKNELEIIDYTYQESSGQPFSINTVTSPFWVNTLWSYMYQYHGQKKYGYTPSFHGRDQSGLLSYLSSDSIDAKYFFLIIEPSNGIPDYLTNDTIAYEDSFSKIIKSRNFGEIRVQKRELTKPITEIVFVK